MLWHLPCFLVGKRAATVFGMQANVQPIQLSKRPAVHQEVRTTKLVRDAELVTPLLLHKRDAGEMLVGAQMRGGY